MTKSKKVTREEFETLQKEVADMKERSGIDIDSLTNEITHAFNRRIQEIQCESEPKKKMDILRAARDRAGIRSDRELCELTGIAYTTFTHKRANNPDSFKSYEMRQIIKKTGMTERELYEFVTSEE